MLSRLQILVTLAVLGVAPALGAAQQSALGAAQQNVEITKGPVVEDTTDNSATIAWSTNVNAGTVLRYGTDQNNLTQTAQTPWGGLTHRVKLQNLQPNTTYYFRAESGQGQGTGSSAVSAVSRLMTENGSTGAGSTPVSGLPCPGACPPSGSPQP